MRTTVKGIRKISVNEINRSMFLDWNSTSEMARRAPHHEFCPKVYKRDKDVSIHISLGQENKILWLKAGLRNLHQEAEGSN